MADVRKPVFNLEKNGVHLAQSYTPMELVGLSSDELGEGTTQHRHLLAKERGEVEWAPALANPPPVLPDGAAWHQAQGRRLVMVTLEAEAVAALSHFFGTTPGVEVVKGSILDQEGSVDAFVSPANSTGNMDGGIDLVYANHFGWSVGRPYHSANPLQLAIDAHCGERPSGAQLPIGEALVVPVVPAKPARTVKFLVATPTMRIPGQIEKRSRTVYTAALAAFRAWRASPSVRAVAMPLFGTGYGGVPVWVAVAQMWEAFVAAWT